jgi:hypothetical protein
LPFAKNSITPIATSALSLAVLHVIFFRKRKKKSGMFKKLEIRSARGRVKISAVSTRFTGFFTIRLRTARLQEK